MNFTEALNVLRPLADGVDPSTGEVLPSQSPFQQAQVVRALSLAVGLVEREARKAELPKGTGKAWTTAEDAQLRVEFHKPVDFNEIARIHERTRGAILARLVRLGELSEGYMGKTSRN